MNYLHRVLFAFKAGKFHFQVAVYQNRYFRHNRHLKMVARIWEGALSTIWVVVHLQEKEVRKLVISWPELQKALISQSETLKETKIAWDNHGKWNQSGMFPHWIRTQKRLCCTFRPSPLSNNLIVVHETWEPTFERSCALQNTLLLVN